MKILILYGTTHDCCKKCAKILAHHLHTLGPSLDVEMVNAKGNTNLEISEYETVIIGGSIRLGKMNKAILNFCKKNIDNLTAKKIGLFVCYMSDQDKAEEYMKDNFPLKLQETAAAKGYFGGELIFEEMASIERSLLKTVIPYEESVSQIDEEGIKDFATDIYDLMEIGS